MSNTRENLEKLAEYLERLPKDYKHFDMDYYAAVPLNAHSYRHEIADYALNNGGVDKINCGAVACAVGHGPAAGILVPKTFIFDSGFVDWGGYSMHAFGVGVYEWLFDGKWAQFDNTHRGAAARIRYYLQNGIPRYFDGIDEDREDEAREWVAEYQEFLVDA